MAILGGNGPEVSPERPEVAHSTGFRLGKDELLKDMEGIYISIILYIYIYIYYVVFAQG
jgi:hypothetical protein